MAVTDYSTTPSSNTLISGINIGEGCPPANINDAIRQLMADLAASPASKIIGTDIQAYNAKLAALAALTLAADKLIYATGANTLAAADLTSFARTLLAETDAAGVRDELGLGDMATKDDVAIADIDATGTADATTRLAGDGTWKPVKSSSAQVATTSGTAHDFGSIPTDATEIDLVFLGVSLSGNDNFLVQMLDAVGSPITSGYNSGYSSLFNAVATTSTTSGFIAGSGGAAGVSIGRMRFTKVPGTTVWLAEHTMKNSDAANSVGAGMVDAGGPVTGVRLTRAGSTSFDAGSAYVEYR